MKKSTLFIALLLFIKIAIGQVTVTITVMNNLSPSIAVSGASVTITPPWASAQTLTTNANGVATFSIPVPPASNYAPITIAAPGYFDYSSDYLLYIRTTDVSISKTRSINKKLDAVFKVTDVASVPIPNATISISTAPATVLTTDASGNATAAGLYTVGSLDFTTTANGYESKAGTASIPATTSISYTVPTIQLARAYSVTFWVNNGISSVPGVTVSFAGTSLTTDANGLAVFTKKINGNYPYTITKTGFVDKYGSVTVAGADVYPIVSLSAGYDLSFTLINGASPSTTGLEQDTITIDGNTKITTSTNKVLTFGVAPGSSYSFTNVKAGFLGVPVSVSNIQANQAMTLYMVPDYKVKFTIQDGSTYAKVAGAKVTMNGTEITTGSDGIALFTNVPPSATSYPFTITGPAGAGYYNSTGTVPAALVSSNYKYNGNNIIGKSAYLSKAYAFIGLTTNNGMMNYYGVATINFNGVDYAYDSGLGGNSWDVPPGTYPYIITPADETTAIKIGTLTVSTTAPGQAYIDVVAGKKIEMYVTDNSPAQNPIQGASITLDGVTKTTDANGYALYPRKAVSTSFPYTVSRPGYTSASGTAAVVTANIVKITALTPIPYSLKFLVKIGTLSISNASVTMGGVTVLTDVNGIATFDNSTWGTYAYTVTKLGYNTKTGNVSVDGNKIVDVAMELTLYSLTMNVTSGGNALAGATVTVDGIALTSNASGKAIFLNAMGTYAYTVKKAGYTDVSGNVIIGTADLTQNVALVLTPYTLTFNVTSGGIALQNAYVYVGTDSTASDATGKVVFTRTMGTYAYKVKKAGYTDATGNVTITSSNATENVVMIAKVYNVTFKIKSGSFVVAGATVTFDGTPLTTDATGTAVFPGKPAGTYAYKVNKTGFLEATGNITVTAGDVTKDVNFINTGLGDVSAKMINLYPNPTRGNLNITLPKNTDNKVTIRITNMIGAVIMEKRVENYSDQLGLDVSRFVNGVYFVNVKGNGFEKTIKVVKN